MLVLLEIELEACTAGVAAQTSGHVIHGLVFHQLHKSDPQFATAMHDGSASRAFSLSPLYPAGKQPGFPVREFSEGDKVAFRIGLLEDETAHAITTAMSHAALAKLEIGEHLYQMSALRVLQSLSMDEMQVHAADIKDFSIRFQTLTCFHAGKRFLLYPEPRLVIGSLARAWKHACVIPMEQEQLNQIIEGLQIVRYELRTGMSNMTKFMIPGFCGECFYQVDRSLERIHREALRKLLRLLPFTGIGYKTAMGMGQAQVSGSGE